VYQILHANRLRLSGFGSKQSDGLFHPLLLSTGALIPIDSFDHYLIHVIINKIVEQGDKCHSAIIKTLTSAQHGHSFAEKVVAFCDVLSEKHYSPDHLSERLASLIKVVEKGHKCSTRAHGQLKSVCDELSKISKSIQSHVSEIEDETLIAPHEDTPFNGVNTCFVTFPKSVNTAAPTAPLIGMFPSVQDADSDDDSADTVASRNNITFPPVWSPFSRTKHMTFTNVESQLTRIVQDVSVFIEHFERLVDWWTGMKAGLNNLNDTILHTVLAKVWVTSDVNRGWSEVADQFSLYVFKTTTLVTDYCPFPRGITQPPLFGYPPPPPPISPPICPLPNNPRTSPGSTTVASELQADEPANKPKSLWRKFSCI